MNKRLIQSYVLEKYYVSTLYRKSSAVLGPRHYYETIVFNWDVQTRKTGNIVRTEDSGLGWKWAFKSHVQICEELINEEEIKSEREV